LQTKTLVSSCSDMACNVDPRYRLLLSLFLGGIYRHESLLTAGMTSGSNCSRVLVKPYFNSRGTGVSGLKRGLATLPQVESRSLHWSETGMKDPREDPVAVHCFCVCSGSVLLGDLLGVSRSRECDLLSVL